MGDYFNDKLMCGPYENVPDAGPPTKVEARMRSESYGREPSG